MEAKQRRLVNLDTLHPTPVLKEDGGNDNVEDGRSVMEEDGGNDDVKFNDKFITDCLLIKKITKGKLQLQMINLSLFSLSSFIQKQTYSTNLLINLSLV